MLWFHAVVEWTQIHSFRDFAIILWSSRNFVQKTWSFHVCEEEFKFCGLLLVYQGAFALCRVIKKNEQTSKTSDSNGEPKGKRVGSYLSPVDIASIDTSSELPSTSNDISPQDSGLYDESRNSSPITPPEIIEIADSEPALMENNLASNWVWPDQLSLQMTTWTISQKWQIF